ncbi:hypothetical protein [Cohnella herbarum]|uniref:Uncharacterized protein n=1 Tax=Cohnella herbarum TaxID=2728023 RepID=A0A7Z2VR87_9BACL|nr:hypothetical protein [Cohnella herbarum]QJD87602.1 hypothetical protein HH215_33420 [Cohnella herbarum]
MNSIQRTLTFIKDLWFAPFAVFLIGFVFIQGAFSPFLSEQFMFQKILTVTPVSYNLYITNGIYQSLVILLPFILSYILVKHISLYHKLIIWFRRRTSNSILDQLKMALFMAIYIILMGIILRLQLLSMSGDSIPDSTLTAAVAFLLYFIVSLLFYKANDEINRYDRFNNHMCVFYISGVLFIVTLLSVYIYGLQSQVETFNKYNRDGKNIELLKVTYEDGLEKILIKMDINPEYIIGYDMPAKKMNLIPRDKVKKIESYRNTYQGDKRKYQQTFSNTSLEKEKKQIIDLINDYYEIRLELNPNINSINKYISLFTNDFRHSYINGVSPDILLKQMKQEKYRNKEHKDFYGLALSDPETEESDNPNVKISKVYVREYWKARNYDYSFLIKSYDGVVWNIDNIEEAHFTFQND